MASESEYRWLPKEGIALDALGRMKAHFHKPLEPMGEAWFMSKQRHMFHELMEQPIKQVSVKVLSKALTEIASGICCFGHRDEWNQWFKYLLPYAIVRCYELVSYETLLIQDIATAFMSVYWKGIPKEYPSFGRMLLARYRSVLWLLIYGLIIKMNLRKVHTLNLTFKLGETNMEFYEWIGMQGKQIATSHQ